LQKIGMLDLSLIKLLQKEQGCNFFASQYTSLANHDTAALQSTVGQSANGGIMFYTHQPYWLAA